MVGSKCNLKTHVRNLGYPILVQTGAQKPPFLDDFATQRQIQQPRPIFGKTRDIDNRSSALTTTRGLLHHLKTTCTLVHKRLQIKSEFSPTHRKICIPLQCYSFADGDQQTELIHTLANGGRYVALTICRRKFGVVSPETIVAKKLLHLFGFSTTSRLNGEYLPNETWHRQSDKGIGKYKRSPTLSKKFHELWSTKGLKPDLSFYPPSLYRFVPVHRTLSMRH